MKEKTTLVSAFLIDINSFTNLEKYIRNGIMILKSDINKVIYVDEYIYEQIKNYENENTKIIIVKKTDMYLYKYKEQITNFKINSANIEKDSIDFMILMCNKIEYIADAIEKNYFQSSNYVWIDFGIRYICSCSDNDFLLKISKLKERTFKNKIRVGRIWELDRIYNINIYENITWYFAGSVIGGDKDILIKFRDIMREKCKEIIETKKTLMWEVNIWYMIYLENKEIFDTYLCNHNNTVIDEY